MSVNEKHQILVDNGQFMAVQHEDSIELWNSKGSQKYGVLPGNFSVAEIQAAMKFSVSEIASGTKTKLRQIINLFCQ